MLKIFLVLYIVCSSHYSVQIITESNANFEILSRNLLDSLKLHPKLAGEFTEERKKLVDKYVDDFLDLTVKDQENQKTKRSLNIPETLIRDENGTSIFSGLHPLFSIPAHATSKIEIFQHGSKAYVAALEKDPETDSMNFLVFKLKNNKITRMPNWIVPSALEFSLYTKNSSTYIVLKAVDNYHSGIYTFNGKNLKHIENLDFSYATDMKIWSSVFEEHMSVSSISKDSEKVVIYKWLESYFDPIQTIYEEVSKLVSFSIENHNFLVLMINGTKDAEYSEIYKYNIQSDRYEIQQRIPTYNCRDIKFFSLQRTRGYDFYMAIANHISGEHSTEIIPPIIYKYVDGYFLPFQNLPIENVQQFETINIDDTFVLIARSEFSPLKAFQYDGWMFQETTNNIQDYLPKIPPSSIRTFTLENEPVLVTGFPHEDHSLEIYKINFTRKNDLKKFHDDILNWCKKSLDQVEITMQRNITKREIANNINATDLEEKIIGSNSILEQLEGQMLNSLQMEGSHFLQDIRAEEVIPDVVNIRSLSTENINNENISEILENLIDINADADEWSDVLILEHAQIDSNINPKIINGRDANKIINVNDNLQLNRLNIEGTAIFSEPIITKTLNNIPFDPNTILMNDFDQIFENINIDTLQLENLTAKKINGQVTTGGQKIGEMSNFQAKNIEIGGFLNDIDMKTLDKYVLRKSGDQVITSTYIFEELGAKNVVLDKLSGINLKENVVLINSGSYELNQDVQFSKHLTVDKLVAQRVVDTIPISEGKLQVLMKNCPEVQKISAKKFFEEVELLSPIKLQGNIQSAELDKINPTITVDGPLVLTGNFEIIGNTSVESFIQASDFTTVETTNSLQKVLTDGLRLREKEIPIQLNLQQQLNVEEIFIDKINDLNPQNWVITGTTTTQNIHGSKIFLNDITITGNTNFFKINNIDIVEFENSLLRNKGDQVITGKHTIVNVVANDVTGNFTTLGSHKLENILTTKTRQTISGRTIMNGAVKANVSKSQSMQIRGNLNGWNFTKITDDTVQKNSGKPIFGRKIFKNFTVKTLEVPNYETMGRRIIYEDDLVLENSVIQNIRFTEICNGENIDTFGAFLSGKKEEVVLDPREFDNMIILGNVYVESGFLNDVYLHDFEKNTVKIDEENSFEDVNFDGTIISETPVILHGNIENVDLENLVLSHSNTTQKIPDMKIFKNYVQVHGNLKLHGNINNFNHSDICRFGKFDDIGKRIEIHGNVMFTKGPNVNKISNVEIQDILDNVWFKNREKVFDNHMNFQNVTFYGNVTVGGLVDGVNIHTLSDQYFSKTKDQSTNCGMYFSNHVDFTGNLISPKLALNGAINGIKISELPRTVLLQDEDQVFEEMVYLQEVFVEDLQGEYLINDLNPETDLMRYDKENVITGLKKINSLNAKNVVLQNGKTVQKVDILGWMQEAVLKKGIFNVEKRKIFRQNAHFDKGINLQGSMNGELFTNETIMLKSVPQNITGVKRFEVDRMDQMKFKYLKLKGLLNDMQISELVNDHVDQTNLILKSPIQFNGGVFTRNLNLESYKNVNMSEFVTSVLDLQNIDYVLEKYGYLLNISQKIHLKLKDHAFYLKYYEEVQQMKTPEYIVNSCCGNSYLIYFENMNGTLFMNYAHWDEDLEEFRKGQHRLNMGYPPSDMRVFTSGRQQFLYMEYSNYESEQPINGQFLRLDAYNQPHNCGSIMSGGIRQIIPLKIYESECVLLLYQEGKPQIFCDLDLDCNFHYNQCLNASGNYIHATSTRVKDVEFLILVQSMENELQGNVEIWCLHESQFGIRQILYLSDPPPKNVAAITYKTTHFLSVVYRSQRQQGHVDILRYSVTTGNYEHWQRITLDEPISADFAVLPSGELFLLVLGSPSGTLTMYKYEGIARFKKFTSTTAISNIQKFEHFSMDNKHFVTLENRNTLRILKAQFKGVLEES